MLQLNLRIFLDKFMPPAHLRAWTFFDFDKSAFMWAPGIIPSGSASYRDSKSNATCGTTNSGSFLRPIFLSLDIKTGSKKIRPNVYCHLNVEIVSSAARAHRTIQVVNLDAKFRDRDSVPTPSRSPIAKAR